MDKRIEQLNEDVENLLENVYVICNISKVIEQVELYCTDEILPTEHIMPVVELMKSKLETFLELLEKHQQNIWKLRYR